MVHEIQKAKQHFRSAMDGFRTRYNEEKPSLWRNIETVYYEGINKLAELLGLEYMSTWTVEDEFTTNHWMFKAKDAGIIQLKGELAQKTVDLLASKGLRINFKPEDTLTITIYSEFTKEEDGKGNTNTAR